MRGYCVFLYVPFRMNSTRTLLGLWLVFVFDLTYSDVVFTATFFALIPLASLPDHSRLICVSRGLPRAFAQDSILISSISLQFRLVPVSLFLPFFVRRHQRRFFH